MQRTFGHAAIAASGWIGLCLLACTLVACRGNNNSESDENLRAEGKGKMSVTQSSYGKTADGQEVTVYTLTNKNGLVAKVMNYGATWTEMHVPDRNGKMGDVLLGFDDLDSWLTKNPFFGSTTGRVANRIAKGKFTLDGKEYTLVVNNGPNHLHGGRKGLDKQIWKAEEIKSKNGPAVRFTHRDPDMHEGYPGNLDLMVTYTLTNDDELRIDYEAKTDKPTPINLTNHAYFNLNAGKENVLDHVLMINADKYTPTDETLIPTGEIASVEGTPLDFTEPTPIGKRIKQLYDGPGAGYDHNFVLNHGGGKLGLAARVRDPDSGRVMEVHTTEPGVQLYTGNHLKDLKGKGGQVYNKHAGFCLETQHFPDSINQPSFPSVVLRPGDTLKSTTVHKFSAK